MIYENKSKYLRDSILYDWKMRIRILEVGWNQKYDFIII